jgi:hypothetical protein
MIYPVGVKQARTLKPARTKKGKQKYCQIYGA